MGKETSVSVTNGSGRFPPHVGTAQWGFGSLWIIVSAHSRTAWISVFIPVIKASMASIGRETEMT